MRYILLAAGRGTRLNPLTNIHPKCLFSLDKETTVVKRIVDQIKKYDKNSEIFIVTGFMKEKIMSTISGVEYINNPFFEVTNSVASLWFLKEKLTEDTIILNSDIVLSDELAEKLFSNSIKNTRVLLDSSVKINGDYNVQINNEQVVVMSKDLKEYHGEYAGVTLISQRDIEIFKKEMLNMIDNGFYDQWYENVLVQMIFNEDFILGYEDISEYEWTEIDSANDLVKAKKIHS
ncbi:MAG: NTP transferase domain-containing protein [Cetobacterium sp.]